MYTSGQMFVEARDIRPREMELQAIVSSCECWEQNSDPLQEQEIDLTAGPSLQSQGRGFFLKLFL